MILDLTSLDKAVLSLGDAVENARNVKFMNSLTQSQKKLMMSGVIQNFEFTYELCWKFIKRWLAENVGKTQVDGVSRRELFRLATASQLVDGVDVWMFYHQARSQTSHVYDEDTAKEVFEAALNFFEISKQLLAVLKNKND